MPYGIQRADYRGLEATMTRSIETTVTFRRPFTLAALDGVEPAGTYRLV